MINPSGLPHPSPAPHFGSVKVFLIYCPKYPSFSNIKSYASTVEFHRFLA